MPSNLVEVAAGKKAIDWVDIECVKCGVQKHLKMTSIRHRIRAGQTNYLCKKCEVNDPERKAAVSAKLSKPIEDRIQPIFHYQK